MCKFLLLFFICFTCFTSMFAQNLQQTALLHYNKGEYKLANATFEELLKQEPKNAVALEHLGDLAFKNKKWGAAVKYFCPLLKIDANNPRYHYKYAGALGMKAKHNKLKALFLIDGIKQHFTKAANLDHTYIAPRMALVQLYLELPSAIGGSIKKARFIANEIAQIDAFYGKKAQNLITKN